MWPNVDESPLEGYSFLSGQLVVDIIYNPLRTRLLNAANQEGCHTVNGLDMLVGQAVKAIEVWTGTEADHNNAIQILSEEYI
jgi:shikimate dehydrogenase